MIGIYISEEKHSEIKNAANKRDQSIKDYLISLHNEHINSDFDSIVDHLKYKIDELFEQYKPNKTNKTKIIRKKNPSIPQNLRNRLTSSSQEEIVDILLSNPMMTTKEMEIERGKKSKSVMYRMIESGILMRTGEPYQYFVNPEYIDN